jgi:hypothetical protein
MRTHTSSKPFALPDFESNAQHDEHLNRRNTAKHFKDMKTIYRLMRVDALALRAADTVPGI